MTISLASTASLVLASVSDRTPPPEWLAPGFVREVEMIRTHLRPLREPALLISSFAREALNRTAGRRPPRPSAVHVAYAIRWLELVDGAAIPAWQAWLDVSVEQARRRRLRRALAGRRRLEQRVEQVPRDGGDGAGGRDREDPGDDDVARDTPPDGREPDARTDAHDRARDDMRRRDGYAQL
jgi:hypothetical protein